MSTNTSSSNWAYLVDDPADFVYFMCHGYPDTETKEYTEKQTFYGDMYKSIGWLATSTGNRDQMTSNCLELQKLPRDDGWSASELAEGIEALRWGREGFRLRMPWDTDSTFLARCFIGEQMSGVITQWEGILSNMGSPEDCNQVMLGADDAS